MLYWKSQSPIKQISSKMAVLSNSVSSHQAFNFIAGECMCKVPVQVLFLLVLVPGKLLKILEPGMFCHLSVTEPSAYAG